MLLLKLFIEPCNFDCRATNHISEAMRSDEFDGTLVVFKSRGRSGEVDTNGLEEVTKESSFKCTMP